MAEVRTNVEIIALLVISNKHDDHSSLIKCGVIITRLMLDNCPDNVFHLQ